MAQHFVTHLLNQIFDFSGTANTLNPATSEVYTYTIGNSTNSGTQTVYTGYQQPILVQNHKQIVITGILVLEIRLYKWFCKLDKKL